VPVLRFVNSNVLDFMKPSDAALKLFEKVDKKKYLPTQEEMKEVRVAQKEDREENKKRTIERIRKSFQRLGVTLKSKAKGPNPLSMKKKKVERSQSQPSATSAGRETREAAHESAT
jgi:hypothetical protein